MNFQGDHTKHELNFLSIFRHFYRIKESFFAENIYRGNNKGHDHISDSLLPRDDQTEFNILVNNSKFRNHALKKLLRDMKLEDTFLKRCKCPDSPCATWF